MIRLDAATVLLQWSVGGMAFCWFTTRRRQVSLGYGWLLRVIYGMMAAAAAVAGFRYGSVLVRELASIGVALACLWALAVSVRRKGAGVSGHLGEHDRRTARVAAMTGIDRDPGHGGVPAGGREFPPLLDLVPVMIGVVGVIAAGIDAAPNAGWDTVVSLLRVLAGTAFRELSATPCCSATGISPNPACRVDC